MLIIDNIQALLKQKNITKTQMLKDLGLAKNITSDWKSGRLKPTVEALRKLSEYFNVTVDYLLTGEEAIEKPLKSEQGLWIPVLGEIAAGTPITAITNIIDYEEIDNETASKGEHFALKIKGSSMEPKFSNGDVVIVKQQPDIECGQIAVVLVDGENATVKKINKTDKGIMLVPSNPNYEVVFYSNEDIINLPVTILGRVIELRAKF